MAFIVVCSLAIGLAVYSIGEWLLTKGPRLRAVRWSDLSALRSSLPRFVKPGLFLGKMGRKMVLSNGLAFQEQFEKRSRLLREISPGVDINIIRDDGGATAPSNLSLGIQFSTLVCLGMAFTFVLNFYDVEDGTHLDARLERLIELLGLLLLFVTAWFLLPRLNALSMQRQIEDATHRLRLALPNLLDLWVIGLESGQAPSSALLAALESSTAPPTRLLHRRVKRDLDSGLSVADSLTGIGKSMSLNAFDSLSQLLLIAIKQGGPVADRLKQFAEQLRQEIFLAAENDALKAPLRLLAPLVFLIFPSTFIVLLFPIFYQLAREFGG